MVTMLHLNMRLGGPASGAIQLLGPACCGEGSEPRPAKDPAVARPGRLARKQEPLARVTGNR
jgi:hypothetical protein